MTCVDPAGGMRGGVDFINILADEVYPRRSVTRGGKGSRWLSCREANYLLFLARRASDADDIELLEELEDQAREMADMVEARWQAEGL